MTAAARTGEGAFTPPVAPLPLKVPVASSSPNVPAAAMATLLAGLLLFGIGALVPTRMFIQVSHEAAPTIRLAVAASGVSLVIATVVALVSAA